MAEDREYRENAWRRITVPEGTVYPYVPQRARETRPYHQIWCPTCDAPENCWCVDYAGKTFHYYHHSRRSLWRLVFLTEAQRRWAESRSLVLNDRS